MKEQRRHQRIRFISPPAIRVGRFGWIGRGELENLSPGGLMLRCAVPLDVGETIGCECALFDSTCIDLSALVVNKIGDLYTARFQAGPLSKWLIQDAIDDALLSGKASMLSINEVHGRKVMRIVGGLNEGLRNDFMYNLTKTGIAELDLSGVTGIDSVGLELCRIAVDRHRVGIAQASPCVRAVLA